MKVIVKYGLNTETKQEGWIFIQRDSLGIHFWFLPKTEDNCLRILKKGQYYDESDIQQVEKYKLAVYCTSMFETVEDFYINLNGRLIGNTAKDMLEFWVKPIQQELAI